MTQHRVVKPGAIKMARNALKIFHDIEHQPERKSHGTYLPRDRIHRTRTRENRIRHKKTPHLLPPQKQTPRKMSSRQHHRNTLQNALIVPVPHKPHVRTRRVDPLKPDLVRLADVDRTVKSAGPVRPGGIVVWVGYDDSGEAAK